jgi:hypothetical protein
VVRVFRGEFPPRLYASAVKKHEDEDEKDSVGLNAINGKSRA